MIGRFFKKAVEAQYIARPPEATSHLIWRYPQQDVPDNAKITVRQDEQALFFREGRFVGLLGPGAYSLDTANIPFVGELLISSLTGANHYIAEIFFVRQAEFLHGSGARELGSYKDRDSNHVVTLTYAIRFGLRVTDSLALITKLGGMGVESGANVETFVASRLRSQLAAAVGKMMSEQPALEIASNQYNEQIGQWVLQQINDDFSDQGLSITRFVELNLSLDAESEELLRAYGKKRADLQIMADGSMIANNPGFEAFHVAQGQRAALEGLGDGLASGSGTGPILGVGVGLGLGSSRPRGIGGGGGFVPPGAPAGGPTQVVPRRPTGQFKAVSEFYLRTANGQEGPYSVRQLVLRAIADGQELSEIEVRGVSDPDWFSAEMEEVIAREYERRIRRVGRRVRKKGAESGEAQGLFESVFNVALADKVLSSDELKMLAPMAVNAGLAQSNEAAMTYIKGRALQLGCEVEEDASAVDASDADEPPPTPNLGDEPPPPPVISKPAVTYAYFDGDQQRKGLTAAEVVALYQGNPDGAHMVWRKGFDDWTSVQEVDELRATIESADES